MGKILKKILLFSTLYIMISIFYGIINYAFSSESLKILTSIVGTILLIIFTNHKLKNKDDNKFIYILLLGVLASHLFTAVLDIFY